MPKQRRRARGEGSVFKRVRNGRTVWVAELNAGTGETGRRRVSTAYAKTQHQAVQKLEEMRGKVRQGVDLDAGRQKHGAFINTWLEMKTPNLKVSTLRNYQELARLHVKPYLGQKRLEALQPIHLVRWQRELERKKIGGRTRQVAHALLLNVLGDAVKLNCVAYNVAERVDRPRVATPQRKALDHHEIKALLEASRGDRFEAFVLLGLLHGMRLGEIAGLTWGALDLRERVVHVRRTLSEDPQTGKRQLTEPKTESSKREVPLSQLAVDALRRHRARIAAGKWTGPPDPELLIFTDQKGHPIRRSNFHRRVWRPLLKRAGLERIRFHDTRHAAASMQLAAGTDVATVAAMLGHSSPAITMKVYAHALPSATRKAAEKVDQLFGGATA